MNALTATLAHVLNLLGASDPGTVPVKALPSQAKPQRTIADLPPMRNPERLAVHMANIQVWRRGS